MEMTLYLPIEKYNDGDFDIDNNYYASDEEFFDALAAENEKNRNVAETFTRNMGKNIAKFRNT